MWINKKIHKDHHIINNQNQNEEKFIGKFIQIVF